jgi:hypothetical protein
MSVTSEDVLKITLDYIGPASSAFLERQTSAHMGNLKFDDLERKHLPELSRWVGISAGLLIDKLRAKELAARIAAL